MIPVLLVDDDADMLDLMNLAFKESGSFDVTACLDAREAVSILKQRPIEVVVSDLPDAGDEWRGICQGSPGYGV